jgi:uncharacterized membrane protein
MLPARQHDISRLEAFSDAVFAFAHELIRLIAGFIPFAASFALLTWTWYEHNIFFRMGPTQWTYGVMSGRRRQAIESREAAATGV